MHRFESKTHLLPNWTTVGCGLLLVLVSSSCDPWPMVAPVCFWCVVCGRSVMFPGTDRMKKLNKTVFVTVSQNLIISTQVHHAQKFNPWWGNDHWSASCKKNHSGIRDGHWTWIDSILLELQVGLIRTVVRMISTIEEMFLIDSTRTKYSSTWTGIQCIWQKMMSILTEDLIERTKPRE